MAKSEQDVNDSSELKCWSDLLLTHKWVFKKGKSFLLLCAKDFQEITEKDFQNIVDDTLSHGFQTVKITDGFLIEDLTSETKQFLVEKLDKHYQTNWKFEKKYVPPIYPRGFVVQGAENVKPIDLKKHLVILERKSGKKMDFVNNPTVTVTKQKFRVMYSREVDIEFLKSEIENEKFKGNFLKVESLFESDCVRLENLSTPVTDFEILEEFEKIVDCQITFIKRSGNKVAFVYLGNYNDAGIIVKGLQQSKTAKKVFGKSAKFSLFYQASSSPLPQTNPRSKTQNKGSNICVVEGSKSAIVMTKLDKNEPNAYSSEEEMEIEYSNNSAMDYQQPSSSKAKSGAMSSSSSVPDSNQIIRFEFKPSVPYDVMEFVHLSPEVFDALSKKFNKVKVELTKKQANTVCGFSMYYVVTFTLPQNKEMREKYRQGRSEFEENCFKRVQDFLSQLSTKTENFDFTNITAVRSDVGWDQDDADLIVVQNDSQEMVQAFVRWDDIIKGDVTVSGYRNQIDDIFKILKKSAALQAQSRASTSLRIRHQHHQREIPSSSHQQKIPSSSQQHHSYASSSSQQFQKPDTNGKFVQLNPGLIPWFVKFSKTEAGRLFKEVEMRVTDGGVILIGETSAATRAQHWVSEIAPQLVTDHQKLENDDDLEFLTCDGGKQFLEEVEAKTKCSVSVQTKTGQPLSKTSSSVVFEGKLACSDVIVRVVKTDITDHHCDAIVNASNEDFKLLPAGISGSILMKGGYQIQTEMDKIKSKHGHFFAGEAESTCAGNGRLPCKRIIHAVGPRWYSTTDTEAAGSLRACIFRVLLVAEMDGSTSVALPAISCGVFGGRIEVCANIIACGITSYFANCQPPSRIKRVDLVEIADHNVLKEFQLALEPFLTPIKPASQSAKPFHSTGGFGPAITKQPMTKQMSRTETVNVSVKQGDITMERCDAIVNPSNSSFNFNGQVGKIILERGGKTIKDECHRWTKNLHWNQDIRVTSGGYLPTNHIMHIAMPHPWRDPDVVDLLANTLKEADKRKFYSIAIPAIGTGNMAFGLERCACLVRGAIDKFSSKNPKYLRDIRVVIYDRRIIGTFERILLQSKKTVPHFQPHESSVDPTYPPEVNTGRSEPGLVFCSDLPNAISQAKLLVAEYLKKQKLRAKTCIVELNLTKEQEYYWREKIDSFEGRFGVVMQFSITRDGSVVKLIGERDKVKNAKSCLQRGFENYKQETKQRVDNQPKPSPYPGKRPSGPGDKFESQTPTKQVKQYEDREWNDRNDRQPASTSNQGDAGKERDADENKNWENRTKKPECQESSSSNHGQQPDRELSCDSSVTSDVHNNENEKKRDMSPSENARERRRSAKMKEKSGGFKDKQVSGCAPKTDHGNLGGITNNPSVSEGKKTAGIDTDDGRSKSRRDASSRKGSKDDSADFSYLASASPLPDSPQASRKTVTPHVTASTSTDDVTKAVHRKLNEKQKTETSHGNERSGSDDSDDNFEDARSDFSDSVTPGDTSTTQKSPMMQDMSRTKAENVDQVHKNEGKIMRLNSESDHIGDGSEVASGRASKNDRGQTKYPKPAPRKKLPSSGASLSRSTSMENSEQEAKGKSEQIVKLSKQDEQDKLDEKKKGKSKHRAEKLEKKTAEIPDQDEKKKLEQERKVENTAKKSDQRTVGTPNQDDQEKLDQEKKGKSEYMTKKSEQQIIGTSEQDGEEKSELETKEETERRAKKSKQPLREDPLHGVSEKTLKHGTKAKQSTSCKRKKSDEISDNSLEEEADEKEDFASPEEEIDLAANKDSEKKENRKSGKQATGQSSQLGAEENVEQEIEEKSNQGEIKDTKQTRKETPEKKERQKSEQSEKLEPKAEPMQKLDTKVEQEATGNKDGFTFFNLSGKSSKFKMKDWEEDWRNLETIEWLLLDVSENSKKFQNVVNSLGVKPRSKLPKIVQIQQVKNPTLYQKFMAERAETASAKKSFYFYPVVEKDLLENLCGLGWNNSADQSDTPDDDDDDDDEGTTFFHRIKKPMTYARLDQKGRRQVIMADVVLDNIPELVSPTLTITKNERAYPLYVLTFA